MFCSLLQQYFKYENSFQSPLDVIGTLLPALVIHNQVISMPKALHEFLWTSDVVRRGGIILQLQVLPHCSPSHEAAAFGTLFSKLDVHLRKAIGKLSEHLL